MQEMKLRQDGRLECVPKYPKFYHGGPPRRIWASELSLPPRAEPGEAVAHRILE